MSIYYDPSKLLSFNSVYNFVVGGRGIGKTFGFKRKAIKDGIAKGDQFIYLRRYKTELTIARNTFFADIEYLFPEYDLRVNGGMAQYAPIDTREEKKREWITIGFFIALSISQSVKSVAFPKVKTIIFDEFIIEKGSTTYINSEATAFTNFFNTVDRGKDKTRVFFLANSVSIMNPYFIEYEIRPKENDEFIKKFDGFMVVQIAKSSEGFEEYISTSRFGKFINGTEYAKYANENQFSDNHDALLEIKDSKARYMFTLECKTGSFSIWLNMFNRQYFIQSRLPKDQVVYTMLTEKMDRDKTLMTFSDRPLQYLRTAFRQGNVTFDKPSTRNVFTEIFKR